MYVIKLKPAGANPVLTWGSLSIVLVLAAGAGAAAAQNKGSVISLNVPNSQFSTIQSALDAAPSGANVHIKPGTYHETLFVRKQLQIYGSQENGGVVVDGATNQVESTTEAVGLLNYEGNGGGWLFHLHLDGGHAGIVGIGDASLVIDDVEVTGSRLGILWDSAASLTVTHATIQGTKSAGFVNLKGHPAFTEFGINFKGGMGMYIANADFQLSDVHISDNDSVGIYIRHSNGTITGPGTISDSYVAGIWASDSSVDIYSMYVHSNHTDPESGRFGQGIAVLLGDAVLTGVQSSYNEQCGIGSFGADFTLTNTLYQDNLFHVCGETLLASALSPGVPAQETDFTFDDLGGNSCFHQGSEQVCQVTSPGLEPPVPIPPSS